MKSLSNYINESNIFDLSDELDKFSFWYAKKLKSAYKKKTIDVEAVKAEGEKKFADALTDNDFRIWFDDCINVLTSFNNTVTESCQSDLQNDLDNQISQII